MSVTTNPVDELEEPQVGQIYEHVRHGERYQILHVDEQIVLLRSEDERHDGENSHRIERRVHFDSQRESGFFTHKQDCDIDMVNSVTMEWSQVDNVGAVTEENLHDAGYQTKLDIQQADDDELLDVYGLGEKGLENIRELVE